MGIPCLVFLLDDKATWTLSFIDGTHQSGINGENINRLRNELKNEYNASFFKNPDNLSNLVGSAVNNTISTMQVEESGKQTLRNKLSVTRKAYFKWILDDLDKPNPVDNKKATEYYIKSRAIELDVKDESSQKDYWNITDVEAEELWLLKNKIQWEIIDFLKSHDIIKLVAAPFGTGKTSFTKYTAMRIAQGNLSDQHTWIPIYIPLNQNINSIYRDGVDIVQDLNEVIKPDKENVLLICDGIDEYPDPNGIISLKDRLLKIRKELDSGLSISDLKIIFTTRLEAGLPEKFGIRKFIRLLPFTSDQVTEFFEKYGHKDLTFDDKKIWISRRDISFI
jgi:hypothetical protein